MRFVLYMQTADFGRIGRIGHRGGSEPCQLAIPAHVFVKIRPYSTIANRSRLRNSPAASAAGGRLTALEDRILARKDLL
jgi:hypothetical protein